MFQEKQRNLCVFLYVTSEKFFKIINYIFQYIKRQSVKVSTQKDYLKYMSKKQQKNSQIISKTFILLAYKQISQNNNLIFRYLQQYIISLQEQMDQEYYDQYQQYEQPEQIEEDIETKVQLDFYQAQELFRVNKYDEAIEALEKLFQIAQDNNLRTWKAKILNNLLQLFCKCKNVEKTTNLLQKILDVNAKEKITQSAIKSIITTLKNLEGAFYNQIAYQILQFLEKFDPSYTVKGYLFMLEKAISSNQLKEAKQLVQKFQIIEENKADLIAPDDLINFYSLLVKNSDVLQIDIGKKLKHIQMKLSSLENQAYMNEGNLSVLKEALASIYYKEGNYLAASQYSNQAFLDYIRYGKTASLKNLLKINVLLSIATENPQIYNASNYNVLFHESSSPFKSQSEIFALFSLLQAFEQNNQQKFCQQYANAAIPTMKQYSDIYSILVNKIKKRKICCIVSAYKKIKLDYLVKRIGESKQQIEQKIFDLIINERIFGRFDPEQQCLQLLKPPHSFIKNQLKNLSQLTTKF